MITNQINGKVYIGQTIQPLAQRMQRHFCLTSSAEPEMCMAIKRAIKKYGKENFSSVILEECDYSILNEREQYYISKYDSFNNGYNCTPGGACGRPREYFTPKIQKEIIDLYKLGFSLRALGNEYNVSKQTIKLVLTKNNVQLNSVRSYKFSSENRKQIIEDIDNGLSRNEVISKWNITKGYLSQLINGFCRI